jgi:hypothetical protein
MSDDAHDFNNIEMQAVITFLVFFVPPSPTAMQGKILKEIHAILKETLREHAPSYAKIKNRGAQFKCGIFSTCDAPRP